jgi:hypothetical protein
MKANSLNKVSTSEDVPALQVQDYIAIRPRDYIIACEVEVPH